MNKPAGLSRVDYRNMVSIVRDVLNQPNALVSFDTEGSITAHGYYSRRNEEGYIAVWVQVSKGDVEGTYDVIETSKSKDCEGRMDREWEYSVQKTAKPRRYYWTRDWKANKPRGKFDVRSPWSKCGQNDYSQRDYAAEVAGY